MTYVDLSPDVRMRRVWAMPTKDTFGCPPIGDFVWRYLATSNISIDPFARNYRLATYRNDLNPDTAAEYHMDALDFLTMLKERGVVADLAIIDPPYSPRQIKELYDGIGLVMSGTEAHRTASWAREKDILLDLLAPDATVLSFGWNSIGMGKRRGFEIDELLLVCHGAAHNDTICVAERRTQGRLGI